MEVHPLPPHLVIEGDPVSLPVPGLCRRPMGQVGRGRSAGGPPPGRRAPPPDHWRGHLVLALRSQRRSACRPPHGAVPGPAYAVPATCSSEVAAGLAPHHARAAGRADSARTGDCVAGGLRRCSARGAGVAHGGCHPQAAGRCRCWWRVEWGLRLQRTAAGGAGSSPKEGGCGGSCWGGGGGPGRAAAAPDAEATVHRPPLSCRGAVVGALPPGAEAAWVRF